MVLINRPIGRKTLRLPDRLILMNKLILSIKKRFLLPVVFLTAFILWLALCRSHYESYWNGTIHRVQTVDFNMLHHTLPPTLSLLAMAGKEEEIQKVLDSNYGIFGLVVTDPSGREILFKTKAVYKNETWQPKLSVDYLAKQSEPFDYLTDPPPLAPRFQHVSPRVDKTDQPKHQVSGRILGRIYYLRGVPPMFEADLLDAICSNWIEMGGSRRGYILLTLIVLASSALVVTLILYRQKILFAREKELQARETELAIKRKALNHLNADLASQRQKKEWLEQEAELAYQRALRLKEALVNVQGAFIPQKTDGHEAEHTISVRPPNHAASQLLSEVESLLPELTHNAMVLRSHAQVWQTYCAQLEQRQIEMESVLRQQQVYWQQPGQLGPQLQAGSQSQQVQQRTVRSTANVAYPNAAANPSRVPQMQVRDTAETADHPVNVARPEQAAKFS